MKTPANPIHTARRAALAVLLVGLLVFIPSAWALVAKGIAWCFPLSFVGLVLSSWGFACWLGVRP